MERIVYVAAGCFWGVEAYFARIRGILTTESYYVNGGFEGVSYHQVCSSSGHVEAIKLVYSDEIISPEDIWHLFLKIANPYSVNQQGNDKGIQYRSGFYVHEDSKEILECFKKLNQKFEKKHNQKSAIEFKIVMDATKAEENHQKYLAKNPTGYCHINLNDIPAQYLKK